MAENDLKSSSKNGVRPFFRSAIMPLMFAGIVIALAGNVYQLLKTQRLEHDIDLMHKSTQSQITEAKEAISGVLEQNLLRYDELNKQLQGVTATTLEQARSEVKRNRAELAKTIERRHAEMVTQLSDLRSDLKNEEASKLGQISADLERTGSQLQHLVSNLDTPPAKPAPEPKAAPAVAPGAAPAVEQPETAPRKKTFWSKLNPFKYGKKKTDGSEGSSEE